MSSKLGRKGDPRMHKAVAARLDNPNLSLYEALCIGGFDYSENDDKSVTDEKKVTLGQRKNQLSRRLRLARKQGAEDKKASRLEATSINRTLFNDNTGHHDGKNGISISKKDQAGEKNLNGHTNDHLSTLGHHRTKTDLINELAASSYRGAGGRNGEGMGAHPSKRVRFTRCLNSTTFENSCTMAPANLYLQQGWPVGNFPRMNANGTSNSLMPQDSLVGSAQGVNYSSSPFYAPQMQSNQNVPRFQQGSPSVALSSLAQTAQSVGLTLDQLALTLSGNTNSLSKLVAEVRSGDSEMKREKMAADLYQTEVKGLYTKCLLMAGVDSSLAEQNTPTYIKFALRAWEEEGKRLRSLQDTINGRKPLKSSPSYMQGTPNENSDRTVATSDSDGFSQYQTNDHCNHDHNHNHTHNNSQHDANDGEKHDRTKCDARHMHRLGECGHKAIIHQPKDGTPHIDFIVNDQVECYGGQDSVSLAGRSFDTAWPSKYKCKDLDESCAKACSKSVASDQDWTTSDFSGAQEPKIFKLSEIDTGDGEWTFDATEDADSGVMGLFKLGRDAANEVANEVANN